MVKYKIIKQNDTQFVVTKKKKKKKAMPIHIGISSF